MESRSRPSRPPPPSVVTDLSDLRSLQRCHDEAYRLIDQGLTCDEEAKLDEAKQCYMNGLREVNRLLAVNCEQIQGTREQKDTAKSIQQKMNKTKLQIEYRLQSIVEKTQPVPQAMQMDEPPSYEESIASSDGVSNAEFVALGDSVMSEQTLMVAWLPMRQKYTPYQMVFRYFSLHLRVMSVLHPTRVL